MDHPKPKRLPAPAQCEGQESLFDNTAAELRALRLQRERLATDDALDLCISTIGSLNAVARTFETALAGAVAALTELVEVIVAQDGNDADGTQPLLAISCRDAPAEERRQGSFAA